MTLNAYLLVARLPEFLVPHGDCLVNIGDSGLLIGLVCTVGHVSPYYRHIYDDNRGRSQGLLTHKLIYSK